MQLQAKVSIDPSRPVFPGPAALITSIDGAGKANIITLGEVFNISIFGPIILGIAMRPATYSHGLIKASKEFVVNLPGADIVDKVDRCGSVSGRTGIDKFEAFGLTPVPASRIRTPLISECPVNIECRLLEIQTIGDHDLFTGEAVIVHVDEDKIAEDGNPDVKALDSLVYMRGEYWTIGEQIGSHGFSHKK
jgi:flavin reductase (DIM6/NTAB) family NADH-FMN oxidoreductase RutF